MADRDSLGLDSALCPVTLFRGISNFYEELMLLVDAVVEKQPVELPQGCTLHAERIRTVARENTKANLALPVASRSWETPAARSEVCCLPVGSAGSRDSAFAAQLKKAANAVAFCFIDRPCQIDFKNPW